MPRSPDIVCRFLHYNNGESPKKAKTPWHRHDFWQFEFVYSGMIKVEYDKNAQNCSSGTFIIIPSLTDHRINYIAPSTKFMSLKFDAYGIGAPRHTFSSLDIPELKPFAENITQWLKNDETCTFPTRLAIEYLLSMILDYRYFSHVAEIQKDPKVIRKIKLYVQNNSRRNISIAEIAKHVSYSPNHLAALFQKHQGMSLKKYTDSVRGKYISEYLHYTDASSKVIADKFGFPDIYSFSRFCQRVLGESPRAIRKEHQNTFSE